MNATVIAWAKYLAMAVPLIGAAGTVVHFAEDIRSSLADIRKEQVEIRRMQGTIVSTMDRRFDKIEDGHDRIVSEATAGMSGLAIEIGRVSGRLEERAGQ